MFLPVPLWVPVRLTPRAEYALIAIGTTSCLDTGALPFHADSESCYGVNVWSRDKFRMCCISTTLKIK